MANHNLLMVETVDQSQHLDDGPWKRGARMHVCGFTEYIVELAAFLALFDEIDGTLGIVEILMVRVEKDGFSAVAVLKTNARLKTVFFLFIFYGAHGVKIVSLQVVIPLLSYHVAPDGQIIKGDFLGAVFFRHDVTSLC